MRVSTSLRLAALLFVACAEQPASRPSDKSAATASQEARESLVPAGATAEQALAVLARRDAAGLIADGPIMQGTLVEGERSDRLVVLKEGYCYRVLGAGSEGVHDLDLLLFNPDGVHVQQDPMEDRFPFLGIGADICPPAGGAYRIQAHCYKGSGTFALGVYRTP